VNERKKGMDYINPIEKSVDEEKILNQKKLIKIEQSLINGKEGHEPKLDVRKIVQILKLIERKICLEQKKFINHKFTEPET
jgi:hypothetical protein